MQLSTTSTDEELLQMHLPNSSKETEQKAGLDLDALKWNNIPATTTNASMIKGNSPRWLKVFKKWFPVFLNAIHQRQQRGESYPLSSVKADFRATCGMELDHAALGYPKLSDFLRTMPHVCCSRRKRTSNTCHPYTAIMSEAEPDGIIKGDIS